MLQLVAWSFAIMDNGVQSAMISGMQQMLRLSAASWDYYQQVHLILIDLHAAHNS